jgi:hypothetical protein
MRDGIYKVDFRSRETAGKGIAMISSRDFKGIDQTHVYLGAIEGQDAMLSASAKTLIYATDDSSICRSVHRHQDGFATRS